MKLKSHLKNLILLAISLSIGFVTAEFAYRIILYSNLKQFEHLRDPRLYDDSFYGDDYWKLAYLFGNTTGGAKVPHETLGWIGEFDRNTYLHNDEPRIKDKRPVLLYGDSFAQCVGATCFQKILNNDSSFSKAHYFLNYGVGGYGVDQIYLLMQKSLDHFEKPFVIVSIMTTDIDRSYLKVRDGQKPFFTLEKGQLKLSKDSIYSNPAEYFEQNPPQIRSYLYRRLIYAENLIPEVIRSRLRGKWKAMRNKKELNKEIILNMKKELDSRNYDYVFVIFNQLLSPDPEKRGWRDAFLANLFEENNIPYIRSKELITQDPTFDRYDKHNYIDADNGHPTTHFNKMVSEEIKRVILN